MKNKLLKKNYLFLIFLLIVFLFIIISQINLKNFFSEKFKQDYFRNLPDIISAPIKLFFDYNLNVKRMNNDYNVKFLPRTQFLNLDFTKIRLNFLEGVEKGYVNEFLANVKPFYIDIDDNNIFILNANGKLFVKKIDKIYDKSIPFNQVRTNLKEGLVLNLHLSDKNIYVSSSSRRGDCYYLNLYKGLIDYKNINFSKIFNSEECANSIQSGMIQSIEIEEKKYLLLSTAADILSNNQVDPKPQNLNSVFGKILLIDLENNKINIFSSGHRNILGLYVDSEIILSTENGPRGGDEINKIIRSKNYGWPISSYGQKYYHSNNLNDYKSSHVKYGFEEPVFVWIPSIGVSQIIKIDDNFSPVWNNNFLAASLNFKHLIRLKFSNDYSKLLFFENIFIGERIRDIKYSKKNKLIFLALENTGSLGILKKH